MIEFHTNYVILCGPDCSGKTTLYKNIHKLSDYRWNIQDRSWLSMLIYGKLYGRNTRKLARGFWDEITNLNNRMVLVIPTWDVVEERFNLRGDEIQNRHTLKNVHALFEDHDNLGQLPNVMLIDNSDASPEDVANLVTGWLKTKEDFSLDDIAGEVLRFVSNIPTGYDLKDHNVGLTFSFFDDGAFEEADEDILLDPDEGEYYTKIQNAFFDKMNAEILGKNEYDEPQDENSRRFIYTDNSCISFIQALYRQSVLEFNVVLRSTNVVSTFSKDLQFIYYLASETCKFYPPFKNADEIRFKITLNSAHLVR